MGIKVLYCLSMAGWKVSIAADRLAPSPLNWSRYVAGVLNIPNLMSTDRAALARSLDNFCQRKGISVILADAIAAAGLLNELQVLLETPCYAPEPSNRLAQIHDKWLFYEEFKDFIPMPRTALFKNVSDLNESTLDWVGRPFVLKPLNGEAGHGIRRFDACSDAVTYQRTPGKYRALPLLIQQYISGPDFGYSVIADNGRAIMEDVQYRDENDVRAFIDNKNTTILCRAIICKLNYSGPAFIDLRQDKVSGQFYPLECNCRFWSTMTANAWMGINYAEIAACRALGTGFTLGSSRLETYHLPGTIAGYFKQPHKLFRVSGRNWLGFFQAVTDPLPHVLNAVYQYG
jgi:predicted ATP-grasp superfamily ATP-dependent carboligase